MVDESAEGNLFAALRTREADLTKHLDTGKGSSTADKAAEDARQKEIEKSREEARKRLEEYNKKPETERKVPEFGSEKDFQLIQAISKLKGGTVVASKTLTERKEEKKE